MPDTGTVTASRQVCLEAEGLLEGRKLELAIAGFDRAEQMGEEPDVCAGGRWLAWMLLGDFPAAWRESDAIRRRGRPDAQRFWDGTPIAGRSVIVRCLHGFGDAVQFLRYLPLLQEMCRSVVVELPPRLMCLAPSLCGTAEVITWGEGAPREQPEWDVQVEVMELPHLFRTEMADLPLFANYLQAPERGCADLAEVLEEDAGPRIGLVTTAGEWNRGRSIPRRFLEPLLESGLRFFSLEAGGGGDGEDEGLRSDARVVDLSRWTSGIDALAAVIAQMDLVITVDTLAAHLAGAMGKPCWMLLQRAADWRWMNDRVDSPWYPSLRLFRQPKQGDWTSVGEQVAAELEAKFRGEI